MSDWHDGMALDALRREAAERLRELMDDGWDGDLNLSDVLDALGAAPATFGVVVMCGSALVTSRVASADVARLADLIDRPTCRAEARDGAAHCSLCGATWAVGALGYCPHCGAEVVG